MSGFFDDVFADIKLAWAEIVYMCLIALGTIEQLIRSGSRHNNCKPNYVQGLSLVMMVLFRYLAAFIIYIILIATIAVCLAGTAFLW